MAIDNIYLNGSSAVYRNSGDTGPFHAEDSDLEDCCCEPDCPSDCSGCTANYTMTLTGFSGCSFGANVNGTYSLTRSGCQWSGTNANGVTVTIICSSGNWLAIFTTPLPIMQASHAPVAGGCLPTGAWTISTSGCTTDGTVTVA